MPIIGAGDNRRNALFSQLAVLEQRLEALANVTEGRPDLDAGDRKLKKQRLEIAKQIQAVQGLIGHSNPAVDGAAQELVTKLWADRLESDDPTLAQYVRRLETKYRAELDLAANGGEVDRHLEAPEMHAMLGLLGDTMSPAKINAMELLLPLMTKEQVEDGYAAVMQVSYDRSLRAHRSGQLEYLGLGAGTMVPLAGTFVFNAAIDAALGPFGVLASVGAITLGEQLGELVKARSASEEFGINREEGEAVDNDLLRLAQRAEKEGQITGSKDQMRRKLRIESSLIGEVLAMRADRVERPSAAEKKAIAALETYREALEANVAKPDVEKLRDARWALQRSFPYRDAGRIPTPNGPTLNQLEPAQVRRNVDQLIRGANRVVLDVTKPPLGRLVDKLENKYDVHERLAAGQTQSGDRATASELSTLRALVGEVPSVAEFIAVSRLSQTKTIDLKDLWPEGTQVTLPDGGTIDSETLSKALASLGDRGDARTQEAFGKTWLPILGRIFGAGFASGLALTGVGIPLAAVVYVLSSIGGSIGGQKVAAAGHKRRILSGVDAAQGKPVHDEMAFVMGRVSDPSSLPKWSTNPCAAITTEHHVAETLAESVGEQLANAEMHTRAAERHLEALEAQLDALPAEARAGQQAQLVPIRNLVANNQKITGQIRATHERLAAYATRLGELADGDAKPDALRAEFLEIRGALLSSSAALEYATTQTERAVVPEGSATVTRYVGAKGAMLRQVEDLVASLEADPSRVVPRYRAFLKPASDAKDAHKKLGRKLRKSFAEDALDDLISKVGSSPWDRPKLSELQAVVRAAPKIRAQLNDGYAETVGISSERAEAIAQEVMSMWSAEVHPLFASGPKSGLHLYDLRTTTKKDDEGMPLFDVQAKINGWSTRDGAGTFRVQIDAEGRPDLDTLRVDVGTTRARDAARFAVEQQMSALGKKDRISDSASPRRTGDGPYSFEFTTRNKETWRVSVTPEGFVDHEGIQHFA